jgi:hypothetical protein
MPLNLAENPLSAAKVGSQDLIAAYAGVTQIFPNSTEITSWTGRGGNSSYNNNSHSLTTSITGPAGATFDLIGSSGAVGQTGLTKAVDGAELFSWSISANSSCDAASRNPSLALQATGSTTLASPLGGRPNPDTLSQDAGPVTQNITPSGSCSATVQNPGNYITVNGQRRWLNGTIVNISYTSNSVTGSQGVGAYNFYVSPTGGSYTNRSIPFGSLFGSGSSDFYTQTANVPAANQVGTFTGTYTLAQLPSSGISSITVRMYLYDTGLSGCVSISPDVISSSTLYP